MFGDDYYEKYHSDPKVKYSFNSWGFRGDDYARFSGQKVNLCIGDSFTLNIGGPIEHSWPYLLSTKFSIPTLNIGINGLNMHGFFAAEEVLRSQFDVQQVFMLCNVLEYTADHKMLIVPNSLPDNRLSLIKDYYLTPGTIVAFSPPWTWIEQDLPALYRHFPDAHNYIKTMQVPRADFEFLMTAKNIIETYHRIAGPSWMPYEEFCVLYQKNENIFKHYPPVDKDLITEFLETIKYFAGVKHYTNRTNNYFSLATNQSLANFFFNEYQKQNKQSILVDFNS
jgi:hypothetical protein